MRLAPRSPLTNGGVLSSQPRQRRRQNSPEAVGTGRSTQRWSSGPCPRGHAGRPGFDRVQFQVVALQQVGGGRREGGRSVRSALLASVGRLGLKQLGPSVFARLSTPRFSLTPSFALLKSSFTQTSATTWFVFNGTAGTDPGLRRSPDRPNPSVFAAGFISGTKAGGVQPCQSGRFRGIFHTLNSNLLLCSEVIVPPDFVLKLLE